MTIRILAFLLLLTAAAPWPTIAYAGATESSYRQARTLIDQSISRMNVGAWLNSPTPLLIEIEGQLDPSAEHQGAGLGTSAHSPYQETWAWDPASGKIGREFKQLHADGREEWIREIFIATDQLWQFDLVTGQANHHTGPSVLARRDRILRRFPPLLLKEALGHAAALRFTGRFGPFDSIQMQTDELESLSLFFGRESHHLGWVEYLTDLPTFGDSTVSWKFSDYQIVEGLGDLPHYISVHINDVLFSELTVRRISHNPVTVESFLAREELPTVIPDQRLPRLESLGKGVHRISDLGPDTHLLVIEFEDFLMVLDAPSARPLLHELPASMVSHATGASAMSHKALRMLQKAIPDKPVRYLLISHFHSDNAGGLLAFSEQELNILVSADQVSVIDEFRKKSHTLCELEAHTDNLHLHAINEHHVINDAQQTIEILEVGPNPHSENMLVAWLPRSKILWAADLQRTIAGGPDANQATLNRFFEQWLERQAIEPELILTARGDGNFDAGTPFRVDSEQTHNLPRDP